MTWNTALFKFVFSFAHRSFLLDSFGVFLAEYLPYFLGAAALLFLFAEKNGRRRWFYFAEMALSLILSRGLVTELIRFFYHHSRPFQVFGFEPLVQETLNNSFPSGHAAFLFALAGVFLFLNRRWGWYFILFALVNGLARVFCGVHWPLDIFGGAVIGILCGTIVHKLLEPSLKAISSTQISP